MPGSTQPLLTVVWCAVETRHVYACNGKPQCELGDNDISEKAAWSLQSVHLHRQAMRTSASSMPTPTSEQPLTVLRSGAAVQRQRVVRRERDMQRRAYLGGHPASLTINIEHASVGKQFTR